MSKKQDRLERKKRKVKAFLEVARLNDADKGINLKSKDPELDSEQSEHDRQAASSQINGDMQNATETLSSRIDEELQRMRAEIKERQARSMERAKIFCTMDRVALTCAVCPASDRSSRTVPDEPSMQMEYPLFAVDLQNLLLTALIHQYAPYKPRWCKLLRPTKLKQVVVMEMNGITKDMFLKHQEALPKLTKLEFPVCVEMISPLQYNRTFLEEMRSMPVSRRQLKKAQIPERGEKTGPGQVVQFVQEVPTSLAPRDCFSRLSLLISPEQMAMEGYPMPVSHKTYRDFIFSKEKYETVTMNSPMFAVDCEMCVTSINENELTHIAVINEKLECIYESHVKPRNRIVNYLTKYSGITKKIMKNVTTRLEDIQKKLTEILPADAILCGQSLQGDLKAMKMFHPYVIDTSIIYNFTGERHMKTSLKNLTERLLGRIIQNDTSGHNPVEDALATMELVLLKLKHGPQFGDVILGGKLKATEPDEVMAERREAEKNVTATDPDSSATKRSHDAMESDSDDDEAPKKRSKVADGSAVAEDDVEMSRRLLFFRKQGTGRNANFFFKITSQGKQKITLVGPPDMFGKGLKRSHVTFMEADSSAASKTLCRSAVQEDSAMVWAQFFSSKYQDEESADTGENVIEDKLRMMDKYVKKVVRKCKPCTLVIVVLTGNSTASSLSNAVCMAKIT